MISLHTFAQDSCIVIILHSAILFLTYRALVMLLLIQMDIIFLVALIIYRYQYGPAKKYKQIYYVMIK